jgi:lysophospholipase L1-like esterase
MSWPSHGWLSRCGASGARITAVLTLAAAVLLLTTTFADTGSEHWVGTWGTSLHQASPGPPGLTNTGFNNLSLRQIVHTSVGGDQVRVRLSTYGQSALTIGAAHIALRASTAAIVPESDRTLTFGGEASITIPPGAVVISDPVALQVPALANLAVTIYVPGPTGPATWHFLGLQTSYISPEGDFTGTIAMPVASTTLGRFWLAGVDVTASKQTGTIAAFGDSVTDGAASTPNSNNRWPDYLARRILAQLGNQRLGVLNQSITGNRLLHDGIGPNGLERFDRDVLAQTGVTHVIVLLGNNDIWVGEVLFPSEAVTAEQIIQGHQQLIRRAHARGLTIYGATLTPMQGFVPDVVFPAVEAKRQAVNAWIRTGGEYDAVIDFDAVTRDPSAPGRLLPALDSGDHLHPNDVGYEAMGKAIDLQLFRNDS